MEASKESMIRKQLCSRLAGSRILVIDPGDGIGQAVLGELRRMSRLTEPGFEVTGRAESMRQQDYVLLFPESGVQGSTAAESELEAQGAGGIVSGNKAQVKKPGGIEMDPWHNFLHFTEQMERIRIIKPRGVLLLSDTSVYGKVFGMPHALKEEETGYVCHTDSKDMNVQCMRMAEHLCGRLAREEGVLVKIARMDRNVLPEIKNRQDDGEKGLTGAGMEEVLAGAILRVLLDGVPGEVYNLPVSPDAIPEIPDEEGHSALSPVRIVPDCGKAGRL